jgi:hypothetical protein
MVGYFSISQGYTTNYRPPISCKIREYFEQFISENILQRKKIITGGKWHINLTIYFVGEGRLGLPKVIKMDKSPRVIRDESIKLYEIFVPVRPIQESDDPLLKTIELMYEAITIFFTTTYRKITNEFMTDLWRKVDLKYLFSLPYPAPMKDQKYSGDVIQPDGSIKNVVPRFD